MLKLEKDDLVVLADGLMVNYDSGGRWRRHYPHLSLDGSLDLSLDVKAG